MDADAVPATMPPLLSRRLKYRGFASADISHLVASAREYGGSDATAGLPPPYALEYNWLRRGLPAVPAGIAPIEWSTCRRAGDQVVGYGCLHPVDFTGRQAQMQFWIVRAADPSDSPLRSEAAECAGALLDFALGDLGLARVVVLTLARQPRLARILEAVGMSEEGCLRKRLNRNGLMEDVICWAASRRAPPACAWPGVLRDGSRVHQAGDPLRSG